ncbi:MAG TPA: hypothetical protein VNN07_15805 [Candidatus Tectomicrobia bacterium]|nr:hypothetical protein [Candidatus Tectomicrobia bacterium]
MRVTRRRVLPFQTREAWRLAALFALAYFAQGMWYLPQQTITVVLKDRGLSAGQVADFFFLSTIPWLIKPLYGVVADLVPLGRSRRKGYFVLMSTLATAAGLTLGATGAIASGPITTAALALPGLGDVRFTLVAGVGLFTVMAVGLAFTDVLTDAIMVETGRPLGLTGAFQSVQWAALYLSAIVVGVVGGWLAAGRRLDLALLVTSAFPLVTLVVAAVGLPAAPASADPAPGRATLRAMGSAMGARDVWVVAGFIFFWTFSPSFGPAFLYYQTDALGFGQQFIGTLDAVASVGSVVGALAYAPLSRRVPLRRLIVTSIGLGTTATLAYLLYRGPMSAIVIQAAFGVVGMVTSLSFLDLAAKACPPRVEATFFALLMSVYNGGTQVSQNVGARLYDAFGYTPLVLTSAAVTAAAWLLVPLVGIERIEARARAATPDAATAA